MFINPDLDHQYDAIVNSVSEITPNVISQAKQNRAIRLTKESGNQVDSNSISEEDLVFRVLTYQHIPLLPPKPLRVSKKMAIRNEAIDKFFEEVVLDEEETEFLDEPELENAIEWVEAPTVKSNHVRVNFPPFWHYRLDTDGNPSVVGKSHWKGTLETGEFSKSHGQMTEKLALMLMKLVEKYALKGNWRNYSYREEMQGQAVLQLCQVALQFDESKSQNPFAFYTQCAGNSFLRILNIEKKNQELRDDMLIRNNMNPSFTRANRDKTTRNAETLI